MKSYLLEHYKKKYGSGGKKTPVRKTGMWYQEGDVVVPSNEITMKGPNGEKDYFDSPIMGIGLRSGESQVMLPGEDYFFPNDDAVLEKKMQKGARINSSLEGISPLGDFYYNVRGSLGNLRAGVNAETNIMNPMASQLNPYLALDGFNLSYNPDALEVSYRGDKGKALLKQTKDKTTEAELQLMLGKMQLDANAQLNQGKLTGFGLSGDYQVNPNLSLYGNLNYIPGQPSDYGVGFRFNKFFQGGGMAIPGVNGTVVAAPMSLKEAYKKKKKKK